MIPYALMALPGPGDAILTESLRRQDPPKLVIHAGARDFEGCGIERAWVRDNNWAARLASSGAQALFVANWEERIALDHIACCSLGGWNLHPSLLPAYRGHNPYFHVLARGERETGVTVHRLTAQMDRGPILLQRRIEIDAEETLGSLWHRLGVLAGTACFDAMEVLQQVDARTTPQSEGDYPTAPRVRPEHLELKPELTVEEARRLVRAANPFYGAWVNRGGRILKVFEAAAEGVGDAGAIPSEGPRIRCRDGVLVATVIEEQERGIMTGRTWTHLFEPPARPYPPDL